ncbi:hypothetical protein V6Z11_D06G051200 [Gossypium hirsutum]
MMKYTVPHKLALRNWMPSKNKSSVNKDLGRLLYKVGKEIRINLGKMVFKKIVTHAESSTTREILPFPFIISHILMSQHNELIFKDEVTAIPQPFKILNKLFSTNGVNDLVHLAFIPTDVEIDEAPNPSVVAAETGELLELLRSELDSLSVEMQRLAAKKAKLAEIICNLEKTPW